MTRAEAVAAAAVSVPASAIVAAYLADWIGLTIAPLAILALSLAVAAGTFAWLWRGAGRDAPALAGFLAIAAILLAFLLSLSWPDLLPIGSGPDLTHHLALAAYIERHWRLVHDVALSVYLGEMVDYTPGSHLLMALTGAWLGRDALHVAYPVVAATVALKAGYVFLIALRLLPAVDEARGGDAVRVPLAVMAVVLLLAPYAYFVGSFTEASYLAQVVSELFAVAMWWAVVAWDQRPSPEPIALFAVAGTAAFLTWPVWTGPLLLLLAVVVVAHRERPFKQRVLVAAIAATPIALIAVMHAGRHVGGLRMVGTGGFTIRPDIHLIGWWFAVPAIAGLLLAVADRRARTLAVFVAALAVQAAALVATARRSGAATPYLAIKMFYLAIYPLAIAAAFALATLWRRASQTSRFRLPTSLPWILVALAALGVGRSIARHARPKPVVKQATYLAAAWARERYAPGCIDYLMADDYSAYWLHLAVFGNPRAAGRGLDDQTYESQKALARWVTPSGLPYAVAEDFSALPKDIREHVDIVARFGPAVVVKRRGPAACVE